MRTSPFRALLVVLTISAWSAAALSLQPAFLLCGCLSAVFLLSSTAAARQPLPEALRAFLGREVTVRLWGTPPPEPASPNLVVEDVNVIGAGVHVFFKSAAGYGIHLKVAQPSEIALSSERVAIGAARYVQWVGMRLAPASDAPAVVISLIGSAARQ